MNIRPLNDRLLVKRLASDELTKSGLIIPDSAKEKPIQGEVIAVGAGRRLKNGSVRALEVKKGQKILFEKWAGSEVHIDGEEHLILREDEVLGTIE